MIVIYSILGWHFRISLFFFIALILTQIYYRAWLFEVIRYIDPDKKVFTGCLLPMSLCSIIIVSIIPVFNFEMMLIMFVLALYNPDEPLSNPAKFVEYIKNLIKNL